MFMHRLGILGLVGALILAVYVVGFVFLGVHDGFFHILFPVGVLLLVAQGVRRIRA